MFIQYVRKFLFTVLVLVVQISSATEGLDVDVYGLHNGEAHLVDDGGVLFSGDSFRLEVNPRAGTYVYVFLIDTVGELTMLNPEVDGASFLKPQGRKFELPEKDHWYRLDDSEGTETLVVIGSPSQLSSGLLGEWLRVRDWGPPNGNGVQVSVTHIRHISRTTITRGAGLLKEGMGARSAQMTASTEQVLSKSRKHLEVLTPSGNALEKLLEKSSNEEVKKTFVTRGVKEVHLFKKAAPSVVLVLTKDGIGTGSLLREDGLILTNWHVIEGYKRVKIAFMPQKRGKLTEESLHDAGVIKVDEVSDLALLMMDNEPKNVEPLKLGTTDELEIGQDVHAIGHPKGEFWTYTKGYVSQMRPDYEWQQPEEEGTHRAGLVIQTQTPINPGNSGGPLLTDDGVIVGVNSFVLSEAEGLNYAISSDDVRSFMLRDGNRVQKIKKTKEKELSEMLGLNVTHIENKDIDEDGKEDLVIVIDQDKNGKTDVIIIESGEDGGLKIIKDENEDGNKDEVIVDSNNNGVPDLHIYYTDGDDEPDIIGYDDDEDGEVDRFEKV